MTSIESIRRAPAGRATRRARVAVSALFLTNGALFANILPRYPEIKAALGLDNLGYGLALAAFPAGAIAAGLLAATLIRRFGSARIAVIGTVLTSLGLLSAALSPTGALFAIALFVGGASDAITDVAQNAHGLRVQRRYGRSIINSFHAIWSIGAVLGGVMAAGAIALQLPLAVHLGSRPRCSRRSPSSPSASACPAATTRPTRRRWRNPRRSPPRSVAAFRRGRCWP